LRSRFIRSGHGGAVPLDNPESFDALNKLDQLLTSLSEHSPKAAGAIFFSIGKLAEHSPKKN
jgi:hypothetical protein